MHWEDPLVSQLECERISREHNLLPETARLLISRGVTEADQIAQFLNPGLQYLLDPNALFGMQAAVERIGLAISQKQNIMIHGDYDADGITSTALLYRFFVSLGVKPQIYIPNRLDESHGINPGVLIQAREHNVKLLITCDCGISSGAAISELKKYKIDTIVTDHHLVPAEGPPKDAIVINPTQVSCSFGDQGMSGVGLAYYLAIGLRRHLRAEGFFKNQAEPNLRDHLDLVALGTIADQAPLIGQNRIFVRNGLTQLSQSEKIGLRTLINLCVSADRNLSVQDVAFWIAPKLNAAGRLGKAEDAFALLIEDDPVKAAVIARKLLNYNDERRRLEDRHIQEAIRQTTDLCGRKSPTGLVLYQADWHHGVLGLVAQRLMQRYRCPVVALADKGEKIHGSGRSLAGVSLIDLLSQCSEHLTTFGGHSVAAGVSLLADKLPSFREKFVALASQLDYTATAKRRTDGVLPFARITERLLEELSQLQPFGERNPEPLFYSEVAKAKEVRLVGEKKQHLRLVLDDSQGNKMAAIGFSLGDYSKQTEHPWQVLFTPEYNIWQGRKSMQLRISEIAISQDQEQSAHLVNQST